MNEILLIEKPKDWTSFDVVAKIRSKYSKKEGKKIKVGHAGTLDPFATGLLIILIGDATKQQESYMKLDKEYEASLLLGHKSTTGDPEGEIAEVSNNKIQIPSLEKIKKMIKDEFTGEITQIPPQYSALKVKGKPAYKYAREGKKVTLKSRKITIYYIEVIDYKYPKLTIKVNCSSGTYIRTLAEDIGRSLHVGAYLTDLKRTKVGDFLLDKAYNIKEITKD